MRLQCHPDSTIRKSRSTPSLTGVVRRSIPTSVSTPALPSAGSFTDLTLATSQPVEHVVKEEMTNLPFGVTSTAPVCHIEFDDSPEALASCLETPTQVVEDDGDAFETAVLESRIRLTTSRSARRRG